MMNNLATFDTLLEDHNQCAQGRLLTLEAGGLFGSKNMRMMSIVDFL
jgi:hypothetical protein